MKMLITGSTGFIGSSILKHFREKYSDIDDHVYGCSRSEVKPYDPHRFCIYAPIGHDKLSYCSHQNKHFTIDLSDYYAVLRMFEYYKPDTILHFAANPIVKLDQTYPTRILDDNIKATQNLLHHCPANTNFIFASTVIVYRESAYSPTETDMVDPRSVYGVTKLASEGLVRAYDQLGKVRHSILRLCATVGPNLTHGVVHDFIDKLKSDSEYLEVLGDAPGSEKPFCHIDDVISALDLILEGRGGTFNIVPDDRLNVEQIANIVMNAIDIHKPIKWLGEEANWKGDNSILKADNGKLRHTGWTPKFTSAGAIDNIVRNYNEDR